MERIFIVAAKRTPIGSFNGSLASLSGVELGAHAMTAVVEQAGIEPAHIDEVIVGNVLTGGVGMGPGRQAAIKAGVPDTVPAYTLNMICGSGMKAIMDGASHIRAGDANLVLTSGMESMSNAAFVTSGQIRRGVRMGHQMQEDSIIKDGLTDAFHHYHMGVTAENVATQCNISREAQDEFALNSQQKAVNAIKKGHFAVEISPITVTERKRQFEVKDDEYPKANATLEGLQALRPAFDKQGSVTAGNASGINDGASAILLASESAVKQHNLTPLAELVEYGQGALAPEIMGLGPVSAVANTLKKAKMTIEDIDVFELNEAFAAQALGVIQGLSEAHHVDENWLLERSNLSGGAIALGHPIGASGNRIVTTLVYQLQRTEKDYGLASLCIGGGMGTALILKRC
ncbi:acetyl-CoA acetyltransferase [Grimontia sp. AD028]|uniref:acetyl-CoA C-acetyltransferase n=1 Tax=Grimontia sp. AD028 TaxID=1581149 RepID=UPI00061AF07C|nr:acetyl-CoA C-acetyltransferase [Grimontia sp. AD028]KKD57828.1 acetyl-CoA acetyltransferase [Grimontia sp. AD028]